MAKDLYIFTMDAEGNLSTKTIKDVCVTRDEPRKIVAKRSKSYNLSMGYYKRYENLEKIKGQFTLDTFSLSGKVIFPIKIVGSCEYLSFNPELPEEVAREMKSNLNYVCEKVRQLYKEEYDNTIEMIGRLQYGL